MKITIRTLLLFLAGQCGAIGEPLNAAVSAFNAYTGTVESRLARQHGYAGSFLAPDLSNSENALTIERLTPSTGVDLPGALLHHWRGTGFAAGAGEADFERLLRDFDSYPEHFSPQVLQARVLSSREEGMQVWMRVSQRHVLTVVLDTTYDITFGRLDAQHGYSISWSTRINEIGSPGTRAEHPLSAAEEHGFLWRQNIYWTWEERDGGLYVQIETVSLTRSIPRGLGWAIGPYVESVPRESLKFTLRAACQALTKQPNLERTAK
jgi:hypothetical protein